MFVGQQTYLLIIACSQRKCTDETLLPAMKRYDGGTYRLLRKAQRDGYLTERLEILILSAKYGLIEASTPIANYNQRMSQKRALELKKQIRRMLLSYSKKAEYQEVYVDIGYTYTLALEDLGEIFKQETITYAKGRMGERLAKLKYWLTKIKLLADTTNTNLKV